MKKRWTALAGVLLVGLLVGCEKTAAGTSFHPVGGASAPVESAAPTPAPTRIPFNPSQEPPLTEFSANIAVPDFLTEEQQDLYRRAHCLYQAMFGGDTSGIDYNFPADEAVEWEAHDEDYFVLGDFRYLPAQGRYQRWEDFDVLVHSVFTDNFWDSRNQMENGYSIYRNFGGRLGLLELARGSGYWYNDNFPDQFRLEEQTGDTISFTLISSYTEVWPREGETYEERDRRLKNVVEYTLEFPIRMVLTESGWRFDRFYSGLADEEPQPEPDPQSQFPAWEDKPQGKVMARYQGALRRVDGNSCAYDIAFYGDGAQTASTIAFQFLFWDGRLQRFVQDHIHCDVATIHQGLLVRDLNGDGNDDLFLDLGSIGEVSLALCYVLDQGTFGEFIPVKEISPYDINSPRLTLEPDGTVAVILDDDPPGRNEPEYSEGWTKCRIKEDRLEPVCRLRVKERAYGPAYMIWNYDSGRWLEGDSYLSQEQFDALHWWGTTLG